MRTYCIAQGTLLNALWWPKWEGNPKKRGYMYMYSWFTLLYSRNWHNSVKQLYCNEILKINKILVLQFHPLICLTQITGNHCTTPPPSTQSPHLVFKSCWIYGPPVHVSCICSLLSTPSDICTVQATPSFTRLSHHLCVHSYSVQIIHHSHCSYNESFLEPKYGHVFHTLPLPGWRVGMVAWENSLQQWVMWKHLLKIG